MGYATRYGGIAGADASWQDLVDALGRAHYVRYDESTATALGEGAQLILDEYSGDLRRMAVAAGHDARELTKLLRDVPRIGRVGADIFCREAQAVWPWLRPYLDRKVVDGARRAGLPADPDRLAKLVPDGDLARFSAALVRVTLRHPKGAQKKGAQRDATTARAGTAGRRRASRARPRG